MARIVPVGGTIGIMGGGQLGRMMAIAGREMGLSTFVWDTAPGGPAEQAADGAIVAPFDDPGALRDFADHVDAATYEFENVSYHTALALAQTVEVFPPPSLLFVSQHRLREKDAARELGLKTTEYCAVESERDAKAAFARWGSGILKTVRGGYDGKGQAPVHSLDEAARGFRALYRSDVLIYEQHVDFFREVSVVVARDQTGAVETFPVSENHHKNGILDWSLVPARIAPAAIRTAVDQARAMARGLGLVGVMALEYFVTRDGTVIFNELAPRPHNSGHWSIEGAWPSQFEQHMRAVAGWRIAPVRQLSPSVMVNLLGDFFADGKAALVELNAVAGAQLHWYGKSEMRPGRKVGHVTIMADTAEEALEQARQAKILLGGAWDDGA